eukprot:m.808638 g.808638  ORF g.808638 m.808638 type:complete len:190 (+) comp59314_c0_seq2:1488-2057(+)
MVPAASHLRLNLFHEAVFCRCALVLSVLLLQLAWNSSALELIAATKAHCELYVLNSFADTLRSATVAGTSFHGALNNLFQLYAYAAVERNLAEFLVDGYVADFQVALIRAKVQQLLASIRPHAVLLVDAFHLSDNQLNSSLGRYDGNVYEHMYAWAQREPLNKDQVPQAVKDYLQPLMREGRARLTSKL